MNLARISINGQITVPAEVRRQLKLNAGDKVIFMNNKDGEIIVKNINAPVITEALKARAK